MEREPPVFHLGRGFTLQDDRIGFLLPDSHLADFRLQPIEEHIAHRGQLQFQQENQIKASSGDTRRQKKALQGKLPGTGHGW